jgi:hypothetical protein
VQICIKAIFTSRTYQSIGYIKFDLGAIVQGQVTILYLKKCKMVATCPFIISASAKQVPWSLIFTCA